MSLTQKPIQGKRQALVAKATELFAQEGYHAVGIDRIIAESGVAKMTLYNHFASKSELVLEVLRQREEQAAESLRAFIAGYTVPLERIKAVFQWHEAWFSTETFCGCMFINAASEFPDHADAIHRAAAGQKQHVTQLIGELLEEMFAPDVAARLAEQFLILIDGATVTAQISGQPKSAMLAWEIAQQLVVAAKA
ncbi:MULTISPECIES: TetR/AcrR family transcriptional regulator [Paraburkholderia]|jgi:AcrR family transcriptional regulator|uniref:Transcriptional regulator, TetR family n=1 Tax=Paraburkholderia phenazinium TaxID=60549 RepID=A0A1N6GRX7_9BURK|nr:TetR/AcrR family transcriptional regulator [Paraburkholderia phenazinium]SIO10243.1 transcriptional regulator, TetR family [Paraburkholderia phenazinium]